jgi:hypothetical protein
MDGGHVGKMPTLLGLFSSDGWLAFGEIGDVDEPIFTREHFHEGAELGDGNNLAGVNLAHFDFLEHAVDHRFGAVEAFLLGSVDVDGAVILELLQNSA